ncbi:MAG TPA: hypothetical protein EYP10_01150, partial [Armatimonadetes bacterium]|nr:hypothetical protein [Armatimonadota bacterium]
IQATDRGLELCIESDRLLMQEVRRTKTMVKRICHAGFLEVVIPIVINDVVVHCLWVGKLRLKPFTDEEISHLAKQCNVDAELIYQYASNVRIVSEHEATKLIQLYQYIAELLKSDIEYHMQLDKMEEQMVELERRRALAEMAMEVAHHFNNMLCAIVGFTEILLAEERDEDKREKLMSILNVSEQAATVIRKVQNFAFTGEHKPDTVHVATLIQEALDHIQPLIEQSKGKIKIELQLQQLTPGASLLECDANALRNALVDILANAIEAMPEGGTLSINMREKDGWFIIEITDTGVGMSEAVCKRAIEPFFSTKGPSRYGMGLSAAYGVVKRHGGNLEIESIEGQGTKVKMMLPYRSIK